MATLVSAAWSAAAAWSYWFCTSTLSICASRSPARTTDPTWTGIFKIWPDAFDFTSTKSIGSTDPFDSTDMVMSLRPTVSQVTAIFGADGLKSERAATAPAIRITPTSGHAQRRIHGRDDVW